MQIILIRSRFSASGNRAIGRAKRRWLKSALVPANPGHSKGAAASTFRGPSAELKPFPGRPPAGHMTEPSEAVRAYLKGASPRFREIHASLARAVREIFPEAEIAFQFKMPGWRIPRLPRRVDLKSVRGTLDPNWAQIYVVERKSGITLNLWNPVDFNGFRTHRT